MVPFVGGQSIMSKRRGRRSGENKNSYYIRDNVKVDYSVNGPNYV